jgi:hypothetical protein
MTSAPVVGDHAGCPEGFDSGLALGAAAVEVHSNIHNPGCQRQWFIEPLSLQQFETPDQLYRLAEPAWCRVQPAVVGVRATQGVQGRDGNQQIAELQRP